MSAQELHEHNERVDRSRDAEARSRGFQDWTEWKTLEDVYQQCINHKSEIGTTVF